MIYDHTESDESDYTNHSTITPKQLLTNTLKALLIAALLIAFVWEVAEMID